MLYPLRNILIFSPVLMAFVIPVQKRIFSVSLLAFSLIAVLFHVYMMFEYMGGSREYFAHQTIRDPLSGYYPRYGGISGETGAAAFAAIFTFQIFVISLFLNNFKILGFLAIGLFFPFAGLVMTAGQARVSLVSLIVFSMLVFLSSRFFGHLQRLFVAIGIYLLLTFVIFWAEINISRAVLLRFESILRGRFDLNEISSGRWKNWGDALEYIGLNPLFGYGYRSVRVLDVRAAENFFIQMLLDVGIIGMMLISYFIFIGVKQIKWNQHISKNGIFRAQDQASHLIVFMIVSMMSQWMFNDVNYYFQTFPAILALFVYFSRIQNSRFESHVAERIYVNDHRANN